MLKFLRDKLVKKSEPADHHTAEAFNRVGKELEVLRQWVMHLSASTKEIHDKHHGHEHNTRHSMHNALRWIDYIKGDVDLLKQHMKETSNYIIEMHRSHKEIVSRLQEVERKTEGHERTSKDNSRTSDKDIQGQLKDTPERSERTNQIPQKNPVQDTPLPDAGQPQVKVVDKSGYSAAQKEFLKVLYEADRPMDYMTLARALNKREKTIRNLLYELREKGVDVQSQHMGDRKKGFYIPREEKLRISGR